jgi:hypothetical protein
MNMKILLKTGIVFCLLFFQTILIKAQTQIFSQKQIITEGRVWDVAFEDLNKDGNSDLVVANWFKPPTIYFNDGHGAYKNHKPLGCSAVEANLYRGHCVGISDFNMDQNLDIFYVFNGRNTLLYKSDGEDSFKVDSINTQNSDGLYISLGDIDNDGDPDAIVTNYEQATILWLNDGIGNFTKSNADFGSNSYNAELGDINNDGYLDIACSIKGKVIVWFNKGLNKFSQSDQSIGYTEGFGRVKLVDMDADKDLDIVLANRNKGGSIWLNDGSGSFTEGSHKLTKSSTMCVGDLDLNGRNDVIFGNTIWLNNKDNEFLEQEVLEFEGMVFGLWLNDADNDEDLDLFYSTSKQENGLILIKNTTKK